MVLVIPCPVYGRLDPETGRLCCAFGRDEPVHRLAPTDRCSCRNRGVVEPPPEHPLAGTGPHGEECLGTPLGAHEAAPLAAPLAGA